MIPSHFPTKFQNALPTVVLTLLAPQQSTYHKIFKRLSHRSVGLITKCASSVCTHQVTARFTSLSAADRMQFTGLTLATAYGTTDVTSDPCAQPVPPLWAPQEAAC
jgi:hypothetical protein